MDDNDVRDLIKVWYERARNEKRDPVSKFVFLWFCFNASLAYESQRMRDRTMIDWLKTQPTSRLVSAYELAYKPETSVFRGNLEALRLQCPIRHPHTSKYDVVIGGVNDFPNIVEAIYQVRCNLFHGSKRASDSRDMKLVQVCGRILEKWIGNLVSAWRLTAKS